MNSQALLIIGLVDHVLDLVETPDAEYGATRTALLAVISTKFSAALLQNPQIAAQFPQLDATMELA